VWQNEDDGTKATEETSPLDAPDDEKQTIRNLTQHGKEKLFFCANPVRKKIIASLNSRKIHSGNPLSASVRVQSTADKGDQISIRLHRQLLPK